MLVIIKSRRVNNASFNSIVHGIFKRFHTFKQIFCATFTDNFTCNKFCAFTVHAHIQDVVRCTGMRVKSFVGGVTVRVKRKWLYNVDFRAKQFMNTANKVAKLAKNPRLFFVLRISVRYTFDVHVF